MFAIDQSRSRGHDLRHEAGSLEANQILKSTPFADQVCPVVFRDSSLRQILAFEHPTEGLQLVRGSIDSGEDARTAALRGLAEEAGITNGSIARDLGTWSSGHDGHVWSLQLCTYLPNPPESWVHQDRKYFWLDVHPPVGDEWAEPFRRALATIRERTRPLLWRG